MSKAPRGSWHNCPGSRLTEICEELSGMKDPKEYFTSSEDMCDFFDAVSSLLRSLE